MNTLQNGTRVKIISLEVLLQEREKFFRFRSREDDPLKTLTPEQLDQELYIDRHEGFNDDRDDYVFSLYRVVGIKFSFWPFTIKQFLIPETALIVLPGTKRKVASNNVEPQIDNSETFEFKLFIDTEFVALKDGYYIREIDNSPVYSREQIKLIYNILHTPMKKHNG